MTLHLRATGRHLPFWITQCYLPPNTSECVPPNPSHAWRWYSIYLPQRDGRLSWPSWLDNAPVGSRTSDLSITSPTPNRCTTKTTIYAYNKYSAHVTVKQISYVNILWLMFNYEPRDHVLHSQKAARLCDQCGRDKLSADWWHFGDAIHAAAT